MIGRVIARRVARDDKRLFAGKGAIKSGGFAAGLIKLFTGLPPTFRLCHALDCACVSVRAKIVSGIYINTVKKNRLEHRCHA